MTYQFHVDYDGVNWRCYETEETLREFEPILPLSNPVFKADWDGISNKLSNVVGNIPNGGIPFMGWSNLSV